MEEFLTKTDNGKSTVYIAQDLGLEIYQLTVIPMSDTEREGYIKFMGRDPHDDNLYIPLSVTIHVRPVGL